MVAMTMLFLLLPVLVLIGVLVGAWVEGRRSEWSFGIGRVISNTFAAIGGAPVAFLIVSFVLNALPQQAVMLLASGDTVVSAGLPFGSAGVIVGFVLLWVFVTPFAKLLMVTLALDTLDGRVVDVRRALATALRLTPAAIVVTILFGLGTFVGLAVLVVPGIVLLLTWFVVLPVLAAERATIFDSFGRSGELLKGMRWRLLLLLMLVGIVWLVVSGLFSVLAIALGGVGQWGTFAAQTVFATLLGMIPSAGVAAIYHEARTAKEGAGSHDLEAVFA